MRRRLLALAVVLAALVAVASAAARPVCAVGCVAAPAGSGPLYVFTGHGWGHGVGLSQYGAYGYAQHGATYRQILGHYYPGTTIGAAPLSRVRVLLGDGLKTVTISSTADFQVRDGDGVVHGLAAGSYPFGPGFKLQPVGADKPQPLTPPLTFLPGTQPLAFKRPYRGQLQVDLNDSGKLRVIDNVPLEQYLYGVVPAEMPYDWAPEALKAQAVVARTYALATRKVGAPFDLYPDTRSQMYLGIEHEQPTTNAAVDATAGQIVLYNGQPATTYFYSTSGGRTANVQDVWGGNPVPYLVSVPDPFDSISPYHDWGPVALTAAKVRKALRAPAVVTDLQAAQNASGRVQVVTLVTPVGNVDVAPTTVRRALGLRSTWFSVGVLSLQQPQPVQPVTYGGTLQLTGVVRGITGVSLEQKPAGSQWQAAATVTPAADGTIAFAVKPQVTTEYRLATTTVGEGSVRVGVAPRVRFYPDKQPGSLRGLVRPVLAGAPVQIQRQRADGQTWSTIANATVDDTGDFTAQLQLVPGTYRARVAPGKGFVAGVTPPLQVVR